MIGSIHFFNYRLEMFHIIYMFVLRVTVNVCYFISLLWVFKKAIHQQRNKRLVQTLMTCIFVSCQVANVCLFTVFVSHNKEDLIIESKNKETLERFCKS